MVTSASARLEHREVLLKSRYFQEQETQAKGVGGSCLEILLPETFSGEAGVSRLEGPHHLLGGVI